MPVIALIGERDRHGELCTQGARNPQPEHIYFMTWFDVFRIDAHGLIAEHWDPSQIWGDGKPPGPGVFP